MYSFATYDKANDRYILKGAIPAQETLRAADTVNPPFRAFLLALCHGRGSGVARTCRHGACARMGRADRETLSAGIQRRPPVSCRRDRYRDTYKDIRFTSDHMAVLGAVGILPMNKLIHADYMRNTLDWVWDNWNWNKTWAGITR